MNNRRPDSIRTIDMSSHLAGLARDTIQSSLLDLLPTVYCLLNFEFSS